MIRHRFLVIGLILCLVSVCLIAACTKIQDSPTRPVSETTVEPTDTAVKPSNPIEITGSGTIIYQDIEGGFFGVLSDDGRQYLPKDIPAKIQVNGTRVSFVFKPSSDTLNMYQWGMPVSIISLKLINESQTNSSSTHLIEYEKAGGVASSYETLLIYDDLRGEVRKWNQVQAFNLTDEEMKNIRNILKKADFISLNTEYRQTGPSPNAITYTITVGNKTIKYIDPEIPGPVVPLISTMNELLERHTVSPIIANMTLDGTAWRLSSYLRSDNIQIPVLNATHISAIFGKDGRVTGSSGCNSYSGTFNQTGTALSFGPVSVTRMACTESGAMETEKTFLEHLNSIRMVSGEERSLTMSDGNNSSLLVFELMKG